MPGFLNLIIENNLSKIKKQKSKFLTISKIKKILKLIYNATFENKELN